jgi:uncharacterized SAM-binding protein YcdF (DUF218 family)
MHQDDVRPTPHPTPLRRAWRVARWPLAALLLAAIGFGVFLDRFGFREGAQRADVIVVLGAKVMHNGAAGDSLRERTLKAATLYHQGIAPVVVCSGGQGRDEPASEAETAARILRDADVPASAIVLEDKSTSTRENARFTADICRVRGWTRVVVVSDPYHLWRARRDFAQVGLTAVTSPANDCKRSRQLPLRIIWTAREVLAVVRDVVSGR